jgi:hypothetical protein
MTVSNHSRTLVHMGSNHDAVGKDPCIIQGAVFENTAPSANLAAGRTTRTKIENHWACVEGCDWVPSISGCLLGTTGGTLAEAKVTTGSPDVFLESKPAGRAQDPTTQNRGNGPGVVTPAAIKPTAEAVEERAKKKCTLVKWSAVTNSGVPLGYQGPDKTGDPNYLEVYPDAVITFTAERLEITSAKGKEKNPVCEAGTHTEWSYKCKRFPWFRAPGEDQRFGVDTFVVPASEAVELWTSASVFQKFASGDLAGAAAAAASQFAAGTTGAERLSEANPTAQGRSDYGGIPKAKYKPSGAFGPNKELFDKAPAAHRNPDWFDGDARQLFFFLGWWLKPPEIKVNAKSCSGERNATIRVLPDINLRFQLKFTGLDRRAGSGKRAETAKQAKDNQKKLEDAQQQKKAAEAARDQAAADEAMHAAKAQSSWNSAATALGKANSLEPQLTSNNPKVAEKAAAKQERLLNKVDEYDKRAKEEFSNADAALAKYNTAAEQIRQIESVLKQLRTCLTIAEQVAAAAGSPLTFEFLAGFLVTVELRYRRTPEQRSAMGWGYYTTATMGQRLKLTLKCDKLFAVDYTYPFPIAGFVDPYCPGLSAALKRCGIRANIVFKVFASIGLEFGMEKSPVDVLKLNGAAAVGKIRGSLGLEFGGAKYAVLTFTVSMVIEAKLVPRLSDKKGVLLEGVPSAWVRPSYRSVLYPDRIYEVELFGGPIKKLEFDWNTNGKTKWTLLTVPAR